MNLSRRGALAISVGLSLSGCALDPRTHDSADPANVAPIDTGPSSWPAPGFNGKNHKSNTTVSLPSEQPQLSFERTVEAGGSPVITDEMLVLNGTKSTSVLGYDLKSEAVSWRSDNKIGKGATKSIICDDRVFVVADKGVAALEVNTGRTIWETDIESTSIDPGALQTLTVANGQLVVGSTKGLVSLNGDGKINWFTKTDPNLQPRWSISREGKNVYVSSWAGKTYAFQTDIEVKNGLFSENRIIEEPQAKKWEAEFGIPTTGPTFHRGRIYQPFNDGIPNTGVVAIDDNSGQVDWKFDMDNGDISLSVVGDTIFIANNAARLYALDAETGVVQWERSFAKEDKEPEYLTLVGGANGVLLNNGYGDIQCFSIEGELRWELPSSGTPTILHTGDQLVVTEKASESNVRIRNYQ